MTSIRIAFLILILVQCTNKNKEVSDNISDTLSTIEIVDLESAFENKDVSPVLLSHFVKDQIELIQLKVPSDKIVNENALRLYVDLEFIILIGPFQMYVFDRNNGYYLHEISRTGRGAGEYHATLHHNAYDYTRKLITAKLPDAKSYIEYDIYGKVVTVLNFKLSDMGFSNMVNLSNEGIYVGYSSNYPENKQQRLKLMDENGKVIKVFYHPVELTKKVTAFDFQMSRFYKFKEELMFFERYDDTLFHVTLDRLVPRFVFNFGDFDAPYEGQIDADYLRSGDRDQDFHIHVLFESSRYLFVRFSYEEYFTWLAVFDKKTKTTTMQQSELGIENDIDGFVPLVYATSVNNEDELIGFTEAYKVADWFKSNPEKAAQLPDHLKKFRSMTASDPPLIMIMKLKE